MTPPTHPEAASMPLRRARQGLLRLFVSFTGLAVLAAAGAWLQADDTSAAKLDLRPGDHICIIGNTLADRMQHDGWLETLLQARFPKHELVVRNLGFSGDEIGGYTDQPDRNRRLR